jgi:hypothetical protein
MWQANELKSETRRMKQSVSGVEAMKSELNHTRREIHEIQQSVSAPVNSASERARRGDEHATGVIRGSGPGLQTFG